MMMMMRILFFVCVFNTAVLTTNAFGVLMSNNRSNNNNNKLTQLRMVDEGSSETTTRKNFLVAAFAGGMTGVATISSFTPDAAWAAKEISATQKRDNYLSTFVYECTKPKGEEQRSRVECIAEGKVAYKASLKPKVVVEPETAEKPVENPVDTLSEAAKQLL